jgi:hypothetical protein
VRCQIHTIAFSAGLMRFLFTPGRAHLDRVFACRQLRGEGDLVWCSAVLHPDVRATIKVMVGRPVQRALCGPAHLIPMTKVRLAFGIPLVVSHPIPRPSGVDDPFVHNHRKRVFLGLEWGGCA